MLELVLLIDFGSTYTKAVAIDVANETVAGIAYAPSTVDTDIMEGLQQAIATLANEHGIRKSQLIRRLACSSAAGGLRLVACGLVPDLTSEAAKRAALGAGAKVIKTFSYELGRQEVEEIEDLKPDIIQLAGGTDGGDMRVILANARKLADARITAPVIVAGNKSVAREVEEILRLNGKHVEVTENVLPELTKLNVEPARNRIRELFMRRITHAKGLDRAEKYVGNILMPTPMAVLNAAKLAAEGTRAVPGLGDLLVVDVGGATTDVHSVAEGSPKRPDVVQRGLPEPYVKRTVEGDLGLRYNARTIVEIASPAAVDTFLPGGETRLVEWGHRVSASTSTLPNSDDEHRMDVVLARIATEIAVKRHVGTVEAVPTPQGKVYVQYGKDLTGVPMVIGTGGIFAYGRDSRSILEAALFSDADPFSLRPQAASLTIDASYIMYAIGLLTTIAPDQALRIFKKSLLYLDGGSAGSGERTR